jgi:hypothetical protein
MLYWAQAGGGWQHADRVIASRLKDSAAYFCTVFWRPVPPSLPAKHV